MAAIFLSSTTRGQIIHVPADQPTIQQGINVAAEGDTVLVDEGTYYENIRFFGKAITVASNFIMDGDTNHINNTIIDGSQPADPDKGSVVAFLYGEDTTSILNGFTITGGTGTFISSNLGRIGGGIACYQSGAKILNNKIINNGTTNSGYAVGGGFCSYNDIASTWVVIENNTISDNFCYSSVNYAFGGGVTVGTHARIVNNSIHDNQCFAPASSGDVSVGGGLYITSPESIDSVFVGSNDIFNNSLEGYTCRGAGIYLSSSYLNLIDNTITNNSTLGTYCLGSAFAGWGIDGEIKIENNLFYENNHEVNKQGMGVIWISTIQNTYSSVMIKNNSIINNLSTGPDDKFQQASILLWDIENFKVIIDANLIKNNQGSSSAGGFYARNSYNYLLTNNIFEGNDVQKFGGAIYSRMYAGKSNDFSPVAGWPSVSTTKRQKKTEQQVNRGRVRPLIANNTFVDNHAGLLGGAVYFSVTLDSICPVLINNIFKDNTADSLPYSVYHGGDEEMLFSHNNIDESLVYGNWAGTGNISGDPMFIDTLFHIDNTSPCFQAGTDSVFNDGFWYYCPSHDFDGNPRPYDGYVDIGAYEYLIPVGVGDDGVQHLEHGIRSYPNPFTATTTIEYELQQPSTVQITIYNHLGKQVAGFPPGHKGQGKHKFSWQPRNLPAGVYYCVLRTENGMKTTKMIKMD